MPKDLVKEGLTFALGVVKISGERFNKVVKGLEKKNKVSGKEGKTMVYAWVNEQQKSLENMRKNLKKEALKTKIYSAKDLENLNKAVKKLSKEIASLQKKKKKVEKQSKKRALKKRTVKAKKPVKKKAVKKKVAKEKSTGLRRKSKGPRKGSAKSSAKQ